MGVAMMPPPVMQAERSDPLTTMLSQAETLAARGDVPVALDIARRAVILSETERTPTTERRYRALQVLSLVQNRVERTAVLDTLHRMATVAEQGWGPKAHRTLWAKFNAVYFATFLAKPGGGVIPMSELAEALESTSQAPLEKVEAANALATVADHYAARGMNEPATAFRDRALAIIAPIPPETSTDIGDIYVAAATVARADDRPGDAIAYIDKAVAAYEAAGGPDHEGIPIALGMAALAASTSRDYDRAERYLRRAVALADARPALRPDIRMRPAMDYGLFLADARQYDLAFPLIERAVAISAAIPAGQPAHQEIALATGRVYLDAGRRDEALLHLERGLAFARRADPSKTRAMLLVEIARAHLAAGNVVAADRALDEATQTVSLVDPNDARLSAPLRSVGGQLATARGDYAGAATLFRQAITGQRHLAPGAPSIAADRIRLATSARLGGTLDASGWRDARAGADSLTADIVQRAANGTGNRSTFRGGDRLMEQSIEVAWTYAKR